jgi:hypothetical protein
MQSRSPMYVQSAWSGRHSNGRPSKGAAAAECRTEARKSLPTAEGAVRPASLAASARLRRFGRMSNTKGNVGRPWLGRSRTSGLVARLFEAPAKPRSPGSNAQNTGPESEGGSLLASGVTQRTMHAGSVPQCALPNPSIERTSPGKPGAASHLKR